MNQSEANAAKFLEIFGAVTLPEIHSIDFRALTPKQIAQLMPAYGGKHATKAILIDRESGKAYGIASGWDLETVAHNGMEFCSGGLSLVAELAGDVWLDLGNHTEAVAAAFMRKMGITDATLHINGRNPCWGSPDSLGCFFRLSEMLAEGSKMTVYNKHGSDFLKSWPDRKFNFVGLPD